MGHFFGFLPSFFHEFITCCSTMIPTLFLAFSSSISDLRSTVNPPLILFCFHKLPPSVCSLLNLCKYCIKPCSRRFPIAASVVSYLLEDNVMEQRSTGDLLDALNSIGSTKGLKAYLDELKAAGYETTLSGYYEYMLKQKDILKKDAISRSFVDRIYAYQIIAGTRKPGRDKLIALCIGGGFTYEETKRALEIAELGTLYSKDSRDSVIIYALNKKLSVTSTNALLEEYGEKPLD